MVVKKYVEKEGKIYGPYDEKKDKTEVITKKGNKTKDQLHFIKSKFLRIVFLAALIIFVVSLGFLGTYLLMG